METFTPDQPTQPPIHLGIERVTQTEERTFTGERAYRAGVQHWTALGWTISTVTNFQPRAGCGRMLALGLFALVWKPKQKFTVVFTKTTVLPGLAPQGE